MNTNLIQKYAVPGPRYTSYPTVPYWKPGRPTDHSWEGRALHTFLETNDNLGISLYIHLPYCESLCTYCGCNTRITKNHLVEKPYVLAVLREWSMYLDLFQVTPLISSIHLGGGTPTFFSPENVHDLLEGILSSAQVTPDAELSFEGHPGNTSDEHLKTLASLGFNRVSYGIQDFDFKVQEAIHRFQTVAEVEQVTKASRTHGYTSINYDLVYGLPFQTVDSIKQTLNEVIRLRPDRIAFYSYAHVPWVKPGQRKFTEMDLPDPDTKRLLYETGLSMLEEAGYKEVGMDHFALQDDPLFIAVREGKLHRNFMGYTTVNSKMLVGLGVSAISDCLTAYVQNEKTVEDYLKKANSGEWPFFRGHMLNQEDLILRKHISNLMCNFETSWKLEQDQCESLFESMPRLEGFVTDGLISLTEDSIQVLPEGQPFIRNICMAFDALLWRNKPETMLFSSTV